jgi:predicted nucleic acid-binding protein
MDSIERKAIIEANKQRTREAVSANIRAMKARANERRERERMALRVLDHILSMSIPVEASDDWSCVKFNLKLEGGAIEIMTGAQYHPSCNMHEVMEYKVQR